MEGSELVGLYNRLLISSSSSEGLLGDKVFDISPPTRSGSLQIRCRSEMEIGRIWWELVGIARSEKCSGPEHSVRLASRYHRPVGMHESIDYQSRRSTQVRKYNESRLRRLWRATPGRPVSNGLLPLLRYGSKSGAKREVVASRCA